MIRKVPIVVGAILGVIHFALVGIPFIQSKGGGEAAAYQILFLDFPLYVLAEAAFQRLLLSSVLFNFLWFVVLGTIMYALIGYAIGLLFSRGTRKIDAET
jgi:hypothetical protein